MDAWPKLIHRILDLIFPPKEQPEKHIDKLRRQETSEQLEEEETEIGDETLVMGVLNLMKQRRKKK
jgi:hypothetical protein